jgi:hypothetical protein
MKVSATNTGGSNTSPVKKQTKISDNDANVGIPLLKDGAYDEGESHEGFMNALNAWRNAGKTD